MVRKLLAVAALAIALTGLTSAPAMAASACLTTSVTVNGTAAPTNGTNCVAPPA